MRKFHTIIAVLAIACVGLVTIAARIQSQHMMIIGQEQAVSGDPCSCPTESYLSCYTGDYAADTDKLCYDSGASNKDGTEGGTPTVSADYVVIDAASDNLCWANSSDDIVVGSLGTLWFTLYVDVATITGHIVIIDMNSGNNNDMIYMMVRSDSQIRGYYRVSDSLLDFVETAGTITEQTEHRIGYTWDQPNDKHKIYIDAAGTEATTAGLSSAPTLTNMCIGDVYGMGPVSHTFRGYDATVLTTYDAADPSPL